MNRKADWLRNGLTALGLVVMALPSHAGGIDDFQLTRAIPADAMVAVHTRDHAGRAFISEQMERVWAAVGKQRFDRDIKRLFGGALAVPEADAESFDEHWQQLRDLAAGVVWSRLGERESAFALKLAPLPIGAEFVVLMMPPEEQLDDDFQGLAALLQGLAAMAPEGTFAHTTEGEGKNVIHRLAVVGPIPMGVTLARQGDVVLIGWGTSMVEQSLALLRGESDPATAALRSTERFQQAFKRLPPPSDSLHFIDLARLAAQLRQFAQFAVALNQVPATQPGEQPVSKLGFLVPLLDTFDLWEYVAGVATTDGMKTTCENITVLRADARSRPLRQVLYGNKPVRDLLKYVPKEATGVSAGSGLDLGALYQVVIDFVGKHVTGGKDFVATWNEMKQTELPIDIEADLLSWIAGGYVSFTANIRSPYVQEHVFIIDVADEAKAAAGLEKTTAAINGLLMPQDGGVEDAGLEGAEGFKRVILPGIFAMIPGLGRPVYGLKDGKLLLGNGPEIVTASLAVAAGERESFAQSERFRTEGLALPDDVMSFSFKDLTKYGEELGQMLSMAGIARMFMPPEVARDPTLITALSIVSKIGRVARELNFYQSECSVTTTDGRLIVTKSVTHYREPPRPPASELTPRQTPPAPEPDPGTVPAEATPAK